MPVTKRSAPKTQQEPMVSPKVELANRGSDNISVASGDEDERKNETQALVGGGGPIAPPSDFAKTAGRFLFCFTGLQVSYLTWGYMQELIMTTTFTPTPSAPDGRFPSAAFCVFSNRFLAIIVAMIAVRIKHGSILQNNVAPLVAFAPCALSNTMSSWSQYASLRYVSFPVQTVFKSSKIIPVMVMGKFLKGTNYPYSQYLEALLITVGVAIFSIASKSSNSDTTTEIIGLLFMCTYITFDSFTSQWQSKVYDKYGKANVDPYQMMLGVNSSAIVMTTMGLIAGGDIPKIIEFFQVNPNVLQYNIITAITSASGQLFIYTTIKEFGPIVFTVIMTTRQMMSICISSILFGHTMTWKAAVGATLVFGVLFYQIRKKYIASQRK
ncbi:adenosine 3'-phospho 5'-phosphosulfate transporter [Skeletonema marinoi]|uniref:Adenosine 3'-phospho 5'-phosphosulfate transporter n=1 Tax=Skeletonema marinoi TaxID=267567 RepID=A0AAD8Y4G5_9STRA|nr:adenosine 3'-phospho 5'-phosphosulfate transporter [Skeletonema marinoi]|mmetsp:Transcript_24342/g.37214  ORF Transcript_24342/g.37214 Transcript_24342/m.37214 type:complete len:382 (-) Transcript_24342:1563-2708(-)|eukprot:scaffold6868_cov120-Skeletonema_marinoi.AAC.6